MKCEIKYKIEDYYSDFNFNNQYEIPNNVVSLVLNEESFEQNDSIKTFNFEKFKNLITLHIEVTLDNINLLENNEIQTLCINHFNLNTLNVSENNKVLYFILYDCYIENLDILTKFKYLTTSSSNCSAI